MSNRLVEIAEESAGGGFFLLTGNASQLTTPATGSTITARLLVAIIAYVQARLQQQKMAGRPS